VVGVAWPSGGQVDLLVHPRHRALDEELLAWAEDRRRDEGVAAGAREPTTLTASAYEGDRARQAVLRRRGYECLAGEGGLYFNTRALDGALPVPRLPEGYTLRHVAGEADLERRVAVHRDAFAPSRMTVAKQRAVMAAPTYRPALDLVAVAPDENFAAFCIVWFDEANRHGVFEPVGCHSAHRRRGLGRAIVAEGLRRLAALGAHTASVCSVVDRVAANGLYTAAGFAPLDCSRAWRKML
jgi:ribosomal protein S18 acetylase RimI-like enzyme